MNNNAKPTGSDVKFSWINDFGSDVESQSMLSR